MVWTLRNGDMEIAPRPPMKGVTVTSTTLALAFLLAWPGAAAAADAATGAASADTLRFAPHPPDVRAEEEGEVAEHFGHAQVWRRAPFGDHLLTPTDQWLAEGRRHQRLDLHVDYNRVDPLRLGVSYEAQAPGTLYPRFGARYELATGRDRGLYGFQLEQPLVASGRYAVGGSAVRVTDHLDLQQVDDLENSLALLFARNDNRDYFEREGLGGYVAWRVPDFSDVSLHLRSDDYRSLPLYGTTRSWFRRDRDLRPNPAIDDGRARTVTLRLDRIAHRAHRARAGFYHWVEIERAGGRLGGDFAYTRALADLRAVVRVSPASTLALRGVAGTTGTGTLPAQRQFIAGGVDVLRAHAQGEYRGNEVALGQAELTAGLWRVRGRAFEGGLHAIAFMDAGRAWTNPDRAWDPQRQNMAVDAGLGVGTSEDNLRLYVARNLQHPGAGYVLSVRLQRPF